MGCSAGIGVSHALSNPSCPRHADPALQTLSRRLPIGRRARNHGPLCQSRLNDGAGRTGHKIWLEPNDDPKRKLKYGWRLVDHENGHFTGVDTAVPNRVLGDALRERADRATWPYGTVRAEVKYGTKQPD